MDKFIDVPDRLALKGVTRRDFVKFCGFMATVLGLPMSFAPRIAEAVATKRPTVVWVQFGECTGCTESFIRSTFPWAADIILDTIDLAYHETVMAAAGDQAEHILEEVVKKDKGKYICIAEGAIPTKDNGAYGKIHGKTFMEIANNVVKNAAATITVGNCSCYGGIPAAKPNPTESKSVQEVTGVKTVNLAGCPPNADNMVATIVHFLLLGKLPAVDSVGRPLFAYGQIIHDNCERRGHFEAEEFVKEFGDEGAAKGWCLFKVGCKGPETHSNCPIIRWNQGVNWPIGAGHPCIGCHEPDFWDKLSPFYAAR
ncbi:MAG TPA: hydrogenase small subunit [Desulfomonilaceae bacterium]|nr:hydrogenase small subunit [Desulfomonilaceae bacterium]